MGCNNSHIRPFFRRCRRRRSKKDEPSVTPKGNGDMIEGNHFEANTDLLQGLQLLGSSVRNPSNKAIDSNNDSPFCVPLLAQSEASSSQLDFFKMLDQKIEEGPDYDPEEDQDDFERNQMRNMDIWNKGIKSFLSEANKTPPDKSSTNCHWDDDGD